MESDYMYMNVNWSVGLVTCVILFLVTTFYLVGIYFPANLYQQSATAIVGILSLISGIYFSNKGVN